MYVLQEPGKESGCESATQEEERKAPLQRDWSEINCCTVVRKPVEKILIR
jgi:hypothetical protein